MTCVAAWLQAALGSNDARRMVVLDESWRMFSHLPIASWMQQSFKLSRASGTMNVMVMHRLSDLAAAGAAGSRQVRLAEGLLADTETRVIYGQPPSEVDHARELLGLSDTEAGLLPQLPRGQALWKVGHDRSWLSIGSHRASWPWSTRTAGCARCRLPPRPKVRTLRAVGQRVSVLRSATAP
jgi:hypothetical protein